MKGRVDRETETGQIDLGGRSVIPVYKLDSRTCSGSGFSARSSPAFPGRELFPFSV